MSLPSAVQIAFDRVAATYDRARRQLIPCFDDFYGAVLDLVPEPREAPLRVLDLGAGTGLLAAMIARQWPQSLITLVDLAPAMLQQARQRLGDLDPGRFNFVAMDYGRQSLPPGFDVAISALSIHHLDDAGKQDLFRRIHAALPPGGLFINAEQVLGATPAVERRLQQDWLQAVRSGGVHRDDLDRALERMREDHCVPLETQLQWLRQAGFEDVECWYRNGRFAVYSGRR